MYGNDFEYKDKFDYGTGSADGFNQSVSASGNEYNAQAQPNESSGMRVVVRGKKRNQNLGDKISFGTIVVLLVGIVFDLSGIGMLIGAIISFIAVDFAGGFGYLFLTVIMLIFGLIPTGLAIVPIIKNKKNIDILKNGIMTKLPISNIIFTNSYLNGIPGYKIEVVNPSRTKGFMHSYCSDVLYNFNIECLREGDLMPIYVDKIDPTKFYMDIENAALDAQNRTNAEETRNVQPW